MTLLPTHLYLYASPECNILDTLFLAVKKLLALTGDMKAIFKLQDLSFPVNNFWNFLQICNEVLSTNSSLRKACLLATF